MGNISQINGLKITADTASYAGTASLAPNYVANSATSSFVTNAQTSSFVQNSQTGSFATTGSNSFKASQTITGSLTIVNDLIVLGSASITNISQSTLNIGTNLITVNTNTPSTRFGGLAVIDSGSSPLKSGSILFDSTNDQWIFIHQTAGITSSLFIMGPETYNNIGNETNLTNNKIPKSVNAEHIGDSNITDNGTIVSINSDTQITGSLLVTAGVSGSFTGSLQGTSSWATNSLTASSVNTLNQNVIITNYLTIGTSSAGATENTLIVGPPPAAGTGEGGQILLQASGGLYTSASMLDNYQNRFRILRGTNASSDAEYFNISLNSGQVAFGKYTGSGVFPGTAVASLAVDSGGNILTTSPSIQVYAKNSSTFNSSGTGAQILTSVLIPANTFTAGDVIRITVRFKKSGTAGTTQTNILLNTSAAIAGATTLKSNVYGTTTLASTIQGAAVIINSTTNTQLPWNATNQGTSEYANSTSAWQESVAINWTTNQYIIFSCNPNGAGDVVSVIHYLIEKI